MNVRFYEKTPGNWWIDVRADGGRKRLPTGATTLASAKTQEAALVARALAALSNAPAPSTVAASGPTLLEAFRLALRTRESWLTAKSKGTLETTYAQLGLPDDTRMATVTRDRVRLLRADWMAEPGKRQGTLLAPSTINHRLSMLSVLLEVCDLPPHGVKHLSVRGNRRIRRITDAEVNAVRVWLMASGRRGAALMARLVTLGLETGARQGELLAMGPGDLNGTTATFRDTKNGESRVVPLTPTALAALAGLGPVPFAELDVDQATKLWAGARDALGLSADAEFVFHSLRHECASRMADRGVDGFTIMAILGHANIATTQVYITSSLGAMQRALGIAS